MPHLSWPVLVLLAVVAALIASGPMLWRTFGPTVGRFMGSAYQKRMIDQLKQKYPLVAARLDGFDLGPGSQANIEAAFKRLPPQKAMEFQVAFAEVREKFMARHPELAGVLSAGEDARAQVKAMNQLLKFPDEQRQAIEKDLIWAWDQLRGRFPALMGPLEAALKKKAEQPVATK